jgi:putative heme iron utilization protein
MHHFFENHGIHILAKHIKQEPVSHIALFDNGVDYFPADESETYV